MRRQKQAIEKENKAKAGISIRWKLALYLSAFVALLLLVTWVFQVMLLNSVYRIVKKEQLRESTQSLALAVETDDLETLAYQVVMEHFVDHLFQ